MNPKDLLSEETIEKKRNFLKNMGEKLKELSGLKEATRFGDLATRTVDRGLTLLPLAYMGVAASSYATANMIGDTQEVTKMIANALTITTAAIGGLGTFLDVVGATANKTREMEDVENNSNIQNNIQKIFQINKSNVVERMVAMRSNATDATDPSFANKVKPK